MKYLVIVLILIGFAPLAHAQAIPACPADITIATDSELRVCLISLIEQVITLENQLIALQTQQVQPVAPTVQTMPTQPTFGVAPEVIKNLTFRIDRNRIYVFYMENGQQIPDVPVTLTADDNGQITHSSVADKYAQAPNTELTNPQVQVFDPTQIAAAIFEYHPTDQGDRTLTATANGIIATTTFSN